MLRKDFDMAASRATARNLADTTPTTDTAATVAPKTRLKVVTTETEMNGAAPKKNSGFSLPEWAFTALENSRVNTFLCDRDGVIVWANRQAFDILGFMEPNLNKMEAWRHFRAADTIGMSFQFLFTDAPEEYRRATDARYHPYRGKIKTGPCVCDVQVTGLYERGELTGYAVDWERITDKIAQEARVRQLMQALETSTANTFQCDLNWNVLYANKKAFDIMEFMEPNLHNFSDSWKTFRAKDVVGKSLDWLFTDEPEQFRRANDPRNHPFHARIKTGPCVCDVTVTSTTDETGKVTGYAVYWERVTEKVKAEKLAAEQLEEGRYLAAKIAEMQTATKAIAAGDLTQHIPVEKADAIGELATAFNEMTASLNGMAKAADSIAAGNLTVHIIPQSEKDVLGNAFATMTDKLSELVAQVRTSANDIYTASSEVSVGTDDLSQRTEEQASSLEETASSMEEMTSTVKQNADNARQANQLAAQAREVAERGGSVVSNAVASMEEINKASKRIADIISVIDEIAFQTNLLALNAAVEAARVGEQGRGFAVVAAEVRNLAGRSATAAKEIKALVADSVQKALEGSALVNQSGQQLNEIVTSVKKVADIISEISAASQEQSVGIEQVNKAITQMDQITQQNAALVEETAASSQAMTGQSKDLQELVAQFQLAPQYLAEPEPRPAYAAPSRKPSAPAYSARRPVTSRPAPRLHPRRAGRGRVRGILRREVFRKTENRRKCSDRPAKSFTRSRANLLH